MKKGIIIGATSGMGYDLAIALLEQGWKLGLAGRSLQVLSDLQKEYGPDQLAIQKIDVNQENCTQLLDELIQKVGGMDCYMHFSGIGKQNQTLEPDIEDNTIQTNVVGFTRMIDYAYHWFKDSGLYNHDHPGQIVAVTSVASNRGMGIAPSYTSTKKYQSTYVEALSQLSHIDGFPVRFTEIQPGFVPTPMLKHPYPCQIPREKALKYILNGILKNKRLVIFDWRYQVAVFFWKLMPHWMWEKITIIQHKKEKNKKG